MAVANGYGKIVISGSVFMYDTGDVINSFKGQPKVNLLTTISKAGTNDSTYFKTNSGTETKFVSNVGTREVHYVNILNDYYGGSGNCCPAPMHFGDFTISPSTTYTYQIIYRTTTGYAHPNYMYHYEYNGGSYVTEYGLWDSSREIDLGDGWKHAWGTFTSNASANRFVTYLFHYEYGVWNKIEVAGVMLTQGSNVIPPRQFIPLATTRTSTQSLLPLVSGATLDLSNVSFDSNAQITYDGTDDYVSITLPSALTVYCLEMVWYNNNTIPNNDTIIGGPSSYQTPIEFNGNGQGVHLGAWTGGLTNEAIHIWGPAGATANQVAAVPGYHHVVFNWNGTTYDIWVDGINTPIQYLSGNNPATLITATSIKLGDDTNGYSFYGQIPVTKIYNRALSSAEVRQNYNKYKTRFNLS